MNKKFILFIDSGIGGLSILEYLNNMNNSLNIIYYADSEHFPYGGKEENVIGSYLLDIYNTVSSKFNIELIVIACNTASVSALKYLRERIEVPIVGTVPAVKLAANQTINKNIGIIATKTTVRNGYLSNLINNFASDCNVYIKAASNLVDAIELNADDYSLTNVISDELSYFNDKSIDCLVLGCTHYSFAEKKISDYFSNTVKIIDSRDGVSKRILTLIDDSFIDIKSLKVLYLSSDKNINIYKDFNKRTNIFKELYIKDTEWKKDSFSGV